MPTLSHPILVGGSYIYIVCARNVTHGESAEWIPRVAKSLNNMSDEIHLINYIMENALFV